METESRSTTRDALSYPCGARPENGALGEIVPGVQWISMPLPFSLGAINLWVLADGEGYTLVDTGVNSDEAMSVWNQLLAGPLAGRELQRVLVTHMHPDHIGFAGWLTRRFGCRLWMTRLEYLSCRMLASDTGRAAPDDGVAFYRRAGWDESALNVYHSRFGNFGRMMSQLPDSYRRVCDGERLRIGEYEWEVVVGAGHSPEHACLYDAQRKLLISGDQVLPRISSNISVHPTEPDADPLAEWLASLDMLRQRVPADVLVLPAHNEPFHGLHVRLDQLGASIQRALERLRAGLQTPKRVVDTFALLFSRPIPFSDASMLSLATGESVAHLNYLLRRGEISRELDAEGVAWYCARPR
ncbi:MBL fold metallo-hydrolase [Pseudomonas sp. LS44]|uniref:MBL fold metallo-hydrolase n=1 Tax=Pseudomonas sp. LS44 TaxID=1357074 RepID=UPI00215AD3E4|nr:MBL fold metallo-hydrolase [Pseudomonas sp. LS44]UVE19546.1 MBL fold metallo-hydrolase [Pseudomonas sp. LS44]